MTTTDLHHRDCYRFVTNPVVGKRPPKRSLEGSTEKSFRAGRRKTVAAQVLDQQRAENGSAPARRSAVR